MSVPAFLELLRRGWWLIVGCVVLGLAGAGAYAWQQPQVYEATTTMYIHPSEAARLAGQSVVSSDVSLLSYGSLVNTFVSITESRSILASVANTLGIPPGDLGRYTVTATLRPKSFFLDVSVDGPDRRRVVPAVNRLSQNAGSAVQTGYPLVALSPLDAALNSSEIQPRLKRDLVYGGLAGLILGFVLAALWVSALSRANGRGSAGYSTGEGRNAEAARGAPDGQGDAESPEAPADLPAAPTR